MRRAHAPPRRSRSRRQDAAARRVVARSGQAVREAQSPVEARRQRGQHDQQCDGTATGNTPAPPLELKLDPSLATDATILSRENRQSGPAAPAGISHARGPGRRIRPSSVDR